MAHTAEEWFQIGLEKLDNQQYNEGFNAFQQCTKIDSPYYLKAKLNCGIIKFKQEDYEEARNYVEQCLERDTSFADAYLFRAFVKSKMGEYESALIDFDKYISTPGISDNSRAYKERGVAYSRLGNNQAAIRDFDQALEISPYYVDAYVNRGVAQLLIGKLYRAQLDLNCSIFIADRVAFFECINNIFSFFHNHPAPYTLHRTLSKFTENFEQFNTLHPIVDTTRQQCKPWKRWEEWRSLSGSEKHEPFTHYHALALVSHYMGDCIEAYRIYDKVLDDVKIMKIPLNLTGLYYYIESAKLFRQPYELILEDALEQIKETRAELIKNKALRELYYAGQILWANDKVMEAHEYFELADDYLPAMYMQVLTSPMMGASEEEMEAKIVNIREREEALPPDKGFLQGFPARTFRLEKPDEDFLAPILDYAHYREIAEAISEVRDLAQPFQHNEMWNAFYWLPEDEKELDWLLRRERLAEINKALLEKFKTNVLSGVGVHQLEHLEAAFTQKLKHDLWEGTNYLGFEDFKTKSGAWPDAAKKVAALLRDSRRLDANSKLLLVEYCHLRGSLSIEDAYLLYFYICYINPSGDSTVASEANSAAVKKIVELVLNPISLTGKVLTAATGGAVAGLFKKFLFEKEPQINIKEFQSPQTSLRPPDDFEVFAEDFLRFISYQREMLGEETFEKQYPLEGFEDRSRKKGAH